MTSPETHAPFTKHASSAATTTGIPELAVVETVRVRAGRRELAIGVVLASDSLRDSYTVELVNPKGGNELVVASSRDLRVRYAC